MNTEQGEFIDAKEAYDRLWDVKTELEGEVARLKAERDELQSFLRSEGYAPCNIDACNCNSWHGGHAHRRLSEIRDCLEGAGHSTNGTTILKVIKSLPTQPEDTRE